MTLFSSTSGKLLRGIHNEFAAYKSDLKSEQWREAQVRRVKLGLPSGGAPPFGSAKNGHAALVPHPTNADVVRQMYERYNRGQGLNTTKRANAARPRVVDRDAAAADGLGLRGGPADRSRSRVRRRTRAARRAHPAVRAPRRVNGAHEAIIDQATWTTY